VLLHIISKINHTFTGTTENIILYKEQNVFMFYIHYGVFNSLLLQMDP